MTHNQLILEHTKMREQVKRVCDAIKLELTALPLEHRAVVNEINSVLATLTRV